MRPSGPLPFREARSTPISSARRRARGEALTSRPSCRPSAVASSSPPVGSCPAEPDGGAAPEGRGADFCAGARSSATAGGVSGSLGVAFGSGTGSAPASSMRAMGAPILAGTPWSTRICRTPSASASRSNVALSDSTSAKTSPVFTSSPLFFFHSTMVPSSIVSESFGMLISDIGFPTEGHADQALDVLTRGDRGPLELLVVRHRHLRAAQPANRRIEVVEAPLLHAGGELGGHAVRRPTLLDDHAAARLAHRVHDGLPVDGTDRAQVDNLGVDVLFLELLRRFVGEH